MEPLVSCFKSSQVFSQLITVNLQCSGIKITKQCSDVNCVKRGSQSGLVWPVLRHILSKYGDLLCKSPYSVRMLEKIRARKNSEHGHFPQSCQFLRFISLNLFLCLHIEISSFFWFRRSFPWCSMINSFSFKHK